MSSTPTILVATSRGLHRIGKPDASGGFAGQAGQASTITEAFSGKHVRALTRSADRLYAVVAHHEIWAASYGAALGDWTRICRVDEQVWSLHEAGHRLLIGTEGAQLYELERSSEERSKDDASSTDVPAPSRSESFADHPERDAWYTPWGGPPAVRSIDTSSDGTIFVNVHVGGIHRSRDGGASWEPTVDLKIDVHQVRCGESGSVVLAPSGAGFAQSHDLGATWQVTDEGLDFPYMRAVAISGQTVLASASNGPHGDRGGVYRRPLEGSDAFARCTDGLPEWFAGNVDTFCLDSTGQTAAIGAPGGSVFVSHDHGLSWREAANGLPHINAVVVLG